MLNDLDNSSFEVVLIPAPEPRHVGHKVRAVQSQNPPWYSALCRQYQSIRGRGRKRYQKPRTFIKRCKVRAGLVRIIEGDYRGVDVDRLVRLIEKIRSRNRAKKELRRAGILSDIPF